jgi:hypothetical protein
MATTSGSRWTTSDGPITVAVVSSAAVRCLLPCLKMCYSFCAVCCVRSSLCSCSCVGWCVCISCSCAACCGYALAHAYLYLLLPRALGGTDRPVQTEQRAGGPPPHDRHSGWSARAREQALQRLQAHLACVVCCVPARVLASVCVCICTPSIQCIHIYTANAYGVWQAACAAYSIYMSYGYGIRGACACACYISRSLSLSLSSRPALWLVLMCPCPAPGQGQRPRPAAPYLGLRAGCSLTRTRITCRHAWLVARAA